MKLSNQLKEVAKELRKESDRLFNMALALEEEAPGGSGVSNQIVKEIVDKRRKFINKKALLVQGD